MSQVYQRKTFKVRAVQFQCDKNRWSNTLEVVAFAGMEFGKDIVHESIPGDPDDRYGLRLLVYGQPMLIEPGDWLFKKAGSESFVISGDEGFRHSFEEVAE